ncbi:unnamed protein product [Darwinula stevensoni]|uniref:tRNA:m(4)X modification enzyme TRM13 n=1 Tax=Darwinula stevensoni TaxID=69355 RepID=A0A7R8X8N7_9CRUS|nr:unnamed protein product [Darwinula stevensoni]CAG0889833.1 unnamed protein product [Darwinula stevensoni]
MEEGESFQRCQFFVEKKKRQCKVRVSTGSQFCGQHLIHDTDSTEKKRKRIPCPLDQNHNCYEDSIAKHLRKCNAREKDKPAYYKKGINIGLIPAEDESESQPAKILDSMSDEEVSAFIQRVTETCQRYEIYAESLSSEELHPAMKSEIQNPIQGASALKHLKQLSSLLSILDKLGFLSQDRSCFVEFGAGRGAMTYWLTQAALSASTSLFVLVDKASNRHKCDNRLRDEKNLHLERVRIDIEDLCLDKIPAISSNSWQNCIAVSKHLCGAGTDVALRCIEHALSNFPAFGLVLATCCHHRCSWDSYVGQSFLLEAGFSKKDFLVLKSMSSWLTCGMTNRPLSLNSVHNRWHGLNLDEQKRESLGRKCKLIIDHGRCEYLKQIEFSKAFLQKYCSNSLTPENMAEVSLMKQARLKVSSVLNKDTENFGKQFMMDGNMETCWNSDQGSPQWIAIAFNSPVFPKRLQVQFQGGFAAKECQLEIGIESLKETEALDPIYPEDVNALQDFQISSVSVPIKFLRIVVNKRKANNLESLPSRKSLRLLLQGNKDGSLSFETMELAYLAAGQSEDEEDIPSGPLQMKDAYISEPDIWDETKLLLGSIQHFRSETSTKDMNLLPLDEYQSTLEELKVTEESFAKVVPFFIVSMEFYPSTSSVLIAAGDGSGRVGIWDVFSSRGTSERVHLFRPHLMAINCLSFQPYFTHHLLTTSCEGNVRSADLQSLVFEEVYHDPDDLKLTCHTFQSPHTILIGRGDGSVTLVDLRGHQKQKGYNAMYPCHSSKKVKSLCFHPLKKELLLTACFGEVCLWDIRGKMTRPITTLPHSSNVPSALFSPLTGRRIATTCTDDHLRLYESEDPSKINLLRSWYHNAGGSLPFKLKWHPQRDDVFFSSSKLIPHRIEAWNSEGMLLSNLTSEDHLQSFCSVVCHHEHMSIVAGGNRSGRVYLFHKGLKPITIERGWPFLPQSDYAAMLVGVAGEWFLFSWHFDRGPLESMVGLGISGWVMVSDVRRRPGPSSPAGSSFRQTTWESESHGHVVTVGFVFTDFVVAWVQPRWYGRLEGGFPVDGNTTIVNVGSLFRMP